MKPNKFVLTLTAATLLPALAFAATDQVVASFERDLQRGMSAECDLQRGTSIRPVAAVMNKTSDPLVDAISVALYSQPDHALTSTNQVLASFERDLQRSMSTESVAVAVAVNEASDPLVDAINVALYSSSYSLPDQVLARSERGQYGDQLMASFKRDLYRDSTIAPTVLAAKAADPLVDAISVALLSDAGEPATNVATLGVNLASAGVTCAPLTGWASARY